MGDHYIYRLGEFEGSDLLEFRAGADRAERKFLRQDSLYVLDVAFWFGLEAVFREVEPCFDMFEDTVITKRQWREMTRLDLNEILDEAFVREIAETIHGINEWVEATIPDGGKFLVIGV